MPEDKKCYICLCGISNHTALSCGHTFCFGCISEWVYKYHWLYNDQLGSCPLCRKKVTKKHTMPFYEYQYKRWCEFMSKHRNQLLFIFTLFSILISIGWIGRSYTDDYWRRHMAPITIHMNIYETNKTAHVYRDYWSLKENAFEIIHMKLNHDDPYTLHYGFKLDK